MKKKFLYLVSLLTFMGILFVIRPVTVEANNQYGVAHRFTTPLATRGIWYYRNTDSYSSNKKTIHVLKITAHTVDGQKLYVPSQKFFKKHVYRVSTKKRNQFIEKTQHLSAAYKFRKGFNVNNWVNLAGDGEYYLPVIKKINGKRVTALQLATGAGPMVYATAYKSKALARKMK